MTQKQNYFLYRCHVGFIAVPKPETVLNPANIAGEPEPSRPGMSRGCSVCVARVCPIADFFLCVALDFRRKKNPRLCEAATLATTTSPLLQQATSWPPSPYYWSISCGPAKIPTTLINSEIARKVSFDPTESKIHFCRLQPAGSVYLFTCCLTSGSGELTHRTFSLVPVQNDSRSHSLGVLV